MYFLADQTTQLRGEKSADHTGAGRRCGEYAGMEDKIPQHCNLVYLFANTIIDADVLLVTVTNVETRAILRVAEKVAGKYQEMHYRFCGNFVAVLVPKQF